MLSCPKQFFPLNKETVTIDIQLKFVDLYLKFAFFSFRWQKEVHANRALVKTVELVSKQRVALDVCVVRVIVEKRVQVIPKKYV